MKPFHSWALKDKKGKFICGGLGMGPVLFTSEKIARSFKEKDETPVRIRIEVVE